MSPAGLRQRTNAPIGPQQFSAHLNSLDADLYGLSGGRTNQLGHGDFLLELSPKMLKIDEHSAATNISELAKLQMIGLNAFCDAFPCTRKIAALLFQIVGRLIFFTLNLITRLIQKFMQNITFFIINCFINTKSSRII